MTALLSRRNVLLQMSAAAMAGVPQVRGTPPPRKLSPTGGIDAILQSGAKARSVPGVVAMAATNEAVIYQGAFGVRAMNASAAMSTDTVFRIASMVKLLTSVAAMQLVERNKLNLDDPAAKVDPSLDGLQVLTGFDAQGVPQLRPARRPVSLRDLLTHTSGFSYQLWDAHVARYLKAALKDPKLPRTPLAFDPGAGWAYGGSLDRVGRLVEIVSGKGLDSYFRDHICGPLGMKDTGFTISEEQRAREASLHIRKADGGLAVQPFEARGIPKTFSGGGGIYSTAPDYLRLLQALLNGGAIGRERILEPGSVLAMSTNQTGDLAAGIMKTTNPALSNDVDFFPGVHLRWSLGHMINLDPVKDGRKAGSLTWAGLYNTYYWVDPASRVAAVIMMQILPFADAPALKLYRQFERGIYRAFA
jgi:methyl acetate hydrolase